MRLWLIIIGIWCNIAYAVLQFQPGYISFTLPADLKQFVVEMESEDELRAGINKKIPGIFEIIPVHANTTGLLWNFKKIALTIEEQDVKSVFELYQPSSMVYPGESYQIPIHYEIHKEHDLIVYQENCSEMKRIEISLHQFAQKGLEKIKLSHKYEKSIQEPKDSVHFHYEEPDYPVTLKYFPKWNDVRLLGFCKDGRIAYANINLNDNESVKLVFQNQINAPLQQVAGSYPLYRLNDTISIASWMIYNDKLQDSIIGVKEGNYTGSLPSLYSLRRFFTSINNGYYRGNFSSLKRPVREEVNQIIDYRIPYIDTNEIIKTSLQSIGLESSLIRNYGKAPYYILPSQISQILDNNQNRFTLFTQDLNKQITGVTSFDLTVGEFDLLTGKVNVQVESEDYALIKPQIIATAVIDDQNEKRNWAISSSTNEGHQFLLPLHLPDGLYKLIVQTNIPYGYSQFGSTIINTKLGEEITILDSILPWTLKEEYPTCNSIDSVHFILDSIPDEWFGKNFTIQWNNTQSIQSEFENTSVRLGFPTSLLSNGMNSIKINLSDRSIVLKKQFYWRGESKQLAFIEPINNLSNFEGDQVFVIASINGGNQIWNSLTLNNEIIKSDKENQFRGYLSLSEMVNTIHIDGVDICGDKQSITRVITKKNHAPIAVINCNELAKASPNQKMHFNAFSSFDQDNQPLSYKWFLNQNLISTTALDSVLITNAAPLQLKLEVTDSFNEIGTNSCDILPGDLELHMDCDDTYTTPNCSFAESDGLKPNDIWHRFTATSVSFLITSCNLNPQFETDQYIYIDADGDLTTGVQGFELRIVLEYLRLTSPAQLHARSEKFISNQWIVNSEDATSIVSGYDGVYLPNGKSILGNNLLEITSSNLQIHDTIRWYFDGSTSLIGSSQVPFVTTIRNENKIVADGRTCDWLNQTCTDDVIGFGQNWLSVYTSADITYNSLFVSQGFQSLEITPNPNNKSLIEVKATIRPLSSYSSGKLSIDLRFPTRKPLQLARLYANSNYLGDYQINSTWTDGKWHSMTWNVSNIVANTDYTIKLQFHVQSDSPMDPFYLDNLRLIP